MLARKCYNGVPFRWSSVHVRDKEVPMSTRILLLVSIVCLFTCRLEAENWAHWRGVAGNGVSSSAKPPTEWSETKNVKWKVAVPGRGSGSPVVWGDQVFVVTAVPAETDENASATTETPRRDSRQQRSRQSRGGRGRGARPQRLRFQVMCFDRRDGKLVWERTATEATPHEGTHATNGYASASPCTDGQHLYAHFGSRGLYCYTLAGELKWKRDDFGQMKTRNGFGEGSSPTLVDDKIVVPWDHEGQSYLFALNKSTGQTIWQTKRDEPTCWATPLIVEHDGGKQIVMNGQTCARAYDVETGRELWRCGGQTDRPAASAVATNGLVFVGSGFRGSFLGAFRLGGQGDIENSQDVAWTIERDTPDIASPLLSDGRLYFYKGKTGLLSCVAAETGKPYYSANRIAGLSSIYASPIAAGGHVYLTGRSGTTVVIKDAPRLEIVATNSVGETVDATPAPVGDQLFIRGERHLFCISTR